MTTESHKFLCENKEYKFIAELLWGGVPVDRIWAEGTKLFQTEYKSILEKYPLLNKSVANGVIISVSTSAEMVPFTK